MQFTLFVQYSEHNLQELPSEIEERSHDIMTLPNAHVGARALADHVTCRAISRDGRTDFLSFVKWGLVLFVAVVGVVDERRGC